MLRKTSMIAGALLVCTPISGQSRIALGRYVGQLSIPALHTQWLLGPGALIAVLLCLAGLCVVAEFQRR